MPTLVCVTDKGKGRRFCHTDCGPADACFPDDRRPEEKTDAKGTQKASTESHS